MSHIKSQLNDFIVELVIEVHERIIATTGGLKGIKDIALLYSAIKSIIQPIKEQGNNYYNICHIKE